MSLISTRSNDLRRGHRAGSPEPGHEWAESCRFDSQRWATWESWTESAAGCSNINLMGTINLTASVFLKPPPPPSLLHDTWNTNRSSWCESLFWLTITKLIPQFTETFNIIRYSSYHGSWCQNKDRGYFCLFYKDAQTPAGAGGVLLNRPQTKQRGFKSLVYDGTQGDNPDTQDTQTIWIRNICKAGLCSESLIFPKQEQRGTKSSEDWRRATASLWICGWDSKQTHHQTTADLSPDLCPTEPYQLWGLTDGAVPWRHHLQHILHFDDTLSNRAAPERTRHTRPHLQSESEVWFSSSSERALQPVLQTWRMFSCWSLQSAVSGRPSRWDPGGNTSVLTLSSC